MSGTVTSDGYNLIGDGTGSSGFTQTGDQVGTSGSPINADLAPLGNYGGPTQTMLPMVGSLAIGTGNDSLSAGSGPSTDQRGFPRGTPSHTGADIGAVEGTLFIVNTTADSDDGSANGPTVSLRDALTASNGTSRGSNVIQFASSLSGSTIVLAGTELPTITTDVAIDGLGASKLSVSGNNASQVLDIGDPNGNSNPTVALSDLTIEDGNSTFGGGLINWGTLTVTDVTFSNNSAPNGLGGAVYNRALGSVGGMLTLTDDTFSNNSAIDSGALDNWAGGNVIVNDDLFDGNSAQSGGAILNEWGTVEVINSTFTANTASVKGGALYNENRSGNSLEIIDSTITGNSSATAGGIETDSGQTLILQNTIVAGNTAATAPDIDGPITNDDGYNLLGISLSGTTSGTGDVFSDTPKLAPLGYYGGPTQTMPLLSGSLALLNGNPSAAGLPSTDQRGFARVVSLKVDIGAFQTQAAPYAVNTADDTASGAEPSGELSLRDAINLGNALAPASGAGISFDIPTSDAGYNSGTGVYTIAVVAALPTITARTTIDGTTQPGFTSTPVIELDGVNAGAAVTGLTVTASNSTIQGLIINRFGGNGIELTGAGAHQDTIDGNLIGTNAGGANMGNSGVGIDVTGGATGNTIGGTAVGAANVIAFNGGDGVHVESAGTTGNLVAGNYVGTNASGAALGNSRVGVFVGFGASGNTVGGTVAAAANVVDFNFWGVWFYDGSSNVLAGNYVGTDAAGDSGRGNSSDGVFVGGGSTDNTIGGTAAGAGNIIASNTNGVAVHDPGTSANIVEGNYIGTDPVGHTGLGNRGVGAYIGSAGTDNTIGGTAAGAANVIAYSAGDGVGVYNSGTTGNLVAGNYIGTDAAGDPGMGNGSSGVDINTGATGNTIGGTASGAANVIASSGYNGVTVTDSGTTGNLVEGNLIGTDAAGHHLGNGVLGPSGPETNNGNGVILEAGAARNVIGGTTPGTANVIVLSANDGVHVVDSGTTGNVVEGNYVGTDAAGDTGLGNAAGGVFVGFGPSDNTVGGTTAGAGNVIGSNVYGVGLSHVGTTGNVVEGNYVGTDANGDDLGNGFEGGVYINAGATDNTVGGTSAVANVIAFNGQAGMIFTDGGTSGNLVLGNLIGTNAAGNTAAPNANGVIVENGATDNTIGGTSASTRNVISGNQSLGVLVQTGANANTIESNYIGLGADGNTALGNGFEGIDVDGVAGTIIGAPGAGNVISSNANGQGISIRTTSNGTVVQGNFIGTDATGTLVRANEGHGIFIEGTVTGTLIGGPDPGDGNVISGNAGAGVNITATVSPATNSTTFEGNFIGTNAAGTRALPNNESGIYLSGSNGNTIGGLLAADRNIISGNNGNGIAIDSSSNNLVEGNYVGTDGGGTQALGNTGAGVWIAGNNSWPTAAADNTIGGTAVGAGNVVSANGSAAAVIGGVYLTGIGASGNVVAGNLIGTDESGTLALGNNWDGVGIEGGATGNTIGGTDAGARNVISANAALGVEIDSAASSANLIAGNFVGTDINGSAALGNALGGVSLSFGATGNTIGGTTASARNIISGNAGDGVDIISSASTGNLIEGNFIGTDVNGTLAVPNGSLVLGTPTWRRYRRFREQQHHRRHDGLGAKRHLRQRRRRHRHHRQQHHGQRGRGQLHWHRRHRLCVPGQRRHRRGRERRATGNIIGGTAPDVQNVVTASGVFDAVYGVAVAANGDLIVADPSNGVPGSGKVVRVNPNTGAQTVISSGGNLVNPDGVALAANGDIYVADSGLATIIRIDPTTGAQTVVSSGGDFVEPTDLAIAPNGDIYVADGGYMPGTVVVGAIIRVDPTTGIQTVVTQGTGPGVPVPSQMAFDAAGDLFAVYTPLAGGPGEVDQVNLTTGTRTMISSGGLLVNAAGLAIDRDGSLLVTNLSDVTGTLPGNIVRINPTTGTQTVAYSGGSLFVPLELAVAPNGDVYVTNYADDTFNHPQVVRIAANAARNVISGNAGYGVDIIGSASTGNLIEGNFIGTDVNGTLAVPNGSLVLGNPTGGGIDDFGSNNTIGGTTALARNIISGNVNHGVNIEPGASGTLVQGNYIGTDVTGTAALGNYSGIYTLNDSNTTIGGVIAGTRNVISGNGGGGSNTGGVQIGGSGDLVEGNYIGTNATGTAALPNVYGVYVFGGDHTTIGGTTAGARNIISGNYQGVVIEGSNTLIEGNYIGLDDTGTTAIGNIFKGILAIAGTNLQIGGTAAGAGNVISSNGEDGIMVGLNMLTVVIQGNLIGTDSTGTIARGNQRGITVSTAGNTIGGTAAGAGNVVAASSEWGIVLTGSGATGNLLQGNYVGTDISGTIALGNGFANGDSGIRIDTGASNNTIGGNTAAARNLISGNINDGIDITDSGTSGNVVDGNFIGTNAAGTAALSNGANGVDIDNGAVNNTIGGASAGAGNVVSGNGTNGISFGNAGSGNVVLGNRIGTDASGMTPLGNSYGIAIGFSTGETIGGTTAGARNLISGNFIGINVDVTFGLVVEGNWIGLNAAGTGAIPNADGLQFAGPVAENVAIGGTSPGAGNVISGNNGGGAILDAAVTTSNFLIQGNLIGTNPSGTGVLGSFPQAGIAVQAGGTTIGGTTAAARNIISGNSYGVLISNTTATGDVVEGNYIGTDITGAVALNNGAGVGLKIQTGAVDNTIGGAAPGAGNLISGNNIGVWISDSGTSGNVVEGNFIGTNAAGTTALANGGDGVQISNSASGNTIGGSAPGAGNLLSGNGIRGLVLNSASGNLIQGNYIGTTASGAGQAGERLRGGERHGQRQHPRRKRQGQRTSFPAMPLMASLPLSTVC